MTHRNCFAPNCTSGYQNNKDKVSFFKVPKNKLKEWSIAIPRADKQLKYSDVLCEKHFFKEDVIREVVTDSYSYPLKNPRLSESAKPSIWPNCPSYLSKKLIKRRRIIERHEYVPPAKRKRNHNASDTNKVLDRSSIKEVPDVPSTSQECNQSISAIIDAGIVAEDQGCTEDNESWLFKLYKKLRKNKITLPSESWTIKFYDNIIAIFETAAIADDVVIKKKIILSQSSLNFFIFQHLHERLTEKSHNKFDDISDFEKQLELFHKLSICYGFQTNDSFTFDLNGTLSQYRKDEFSKRIRHHNCKYLLSAEDHLNNKNVDYCLLCTNAKELIYYLNTKITRYNLFKKNSINCRKRERRTRRALNKVKKELQEFKEKLKTVNKNGSAEKN